MKKFITLSVIVATITALFAFTNNNDTPNYKAAFAEQVTSLDGQTEMLRTYMDSKGIMVVFSCNTCPFVINWEDRYAGLANYCEANNIAFVLVNSNQAKRDNEDSMEAMKAHAKEEGYSFPYLVDHNSSIANLMKAKTTPHVFLFDGDMNLMYRGAIDDNNKDANAVKHTYAMDALKNMVKGKPINPSQTDALGCSIKRVKK